MPSALATARHVEPLHERMPVPRLRRCNVCLGEGFVVRRDGLLDACPSCAAQAAAEWALREAGKP